MVNSAIIVVILSIAVTLRNAECLQVLGAGVNENDKQTILNIHNYLRELIRQGKVPNQPQGINLSPLVWDDKLAEEAQKIANTCRFKHVEVFDNRFSVGQNLGYESTPFPGADWNGVIKRWFDEHKDFVYPNQGNGETGHYLQVVWADTKVIGCGFTMYTKGPKTNYEKIYVCNYGPAGNFIGKAPYKTQAIYNSNGGFY